MVLSFNKIRYDGFYRLTTKCELQQELAPALPLKRTNWYYIYMAVYIQLSTYTGSVSAVS